MGPLIGIGAASAAAVIIAGSLGNAPAAGPSDRLSDRELAAAVMFGCADSRDEAAQMQMARAGVSGIVLLGTDPPSDLKRQLRAVARSAPKTPPLIASDEEGGTVQRLGDLIWRLPSARTMGRWPLSKLRHTADRYGRAMARLGIGMDLAPVADLGIPGSYMDQLGRAFGSRPRKVGRAVNAWSAGMRSAGVIAVPKHWPGHGHAVDTHRSAATVPPYGTLERADLVPFRMAFAQGVDAVMVGHLQSRGLTRPGQPATQSRAALTRLRAQAGPETVIITDSLTMAAASSARGLSEAEAVVAALRAGADWAMACSTRTTSVVKTVGRAIGSGQLDRARLLESVARIDALRGSANR